MRQVPSVACYVHILCLPARRVYPVLMLALGIFRLSFQPLWITPPPPGPHVRYNPLSSTCCFYYFRTLLPLVLSCQGISSDTSGMIKVRHFRMNRCLQTTYLLPNMAQMSKAEQNMRVLDRTVGPKRGDIIHRVHKGPAPLRVVRAHIVERGPCNESQGP